MVTAGAEVVGEGWHRRAGEPHAEVLALAAAGDRARGATLHVTLEPCAHHGRTPPCAEAVIAAGIRRVVACHRDPDPRVGGRGFERLAAAGILLDVGRLAAEAVELNFAYLVARVLGRPAVTLKWAASLDGRIATATGASRWITGERARREALELRETHDAILVGSGTVLADDPRLTRRLGRAGRPILRAVADRRLRTTASARLFDEAGSVVVYTESADAGRRAALERRGAEVVELATVAPAAILDDLAGRSVLGLLVEGGGRLAGAFFDAGLWDRVAAFSAPILIGGEKAAPAIGGAGAESLARAGRLVRVRRRRLGEDLLVTGIREECSRALFESVGV